MITLKSRIVKATALGLVLAVTHVCLSAELVQAASARLVAKASAAQGGPQGRLTTRGNNPVTVNGTSARSGETIFTGQSIQTPEGVGATVNLPGIGRVDIAPNTNLTVSFEAGKVHVALVSGCVIDVCSSATPGGAPIVGQGAASAAGAGASGAGAAAGTAAATAAGSGV